MQLEPGAAEIDQRDLARLTEYSGLSLWVKDPVQLGIVFDRLHRVLDGTHWTHAASFRLESPTAGVFQSGRTIRGKLSFVECPFECSGMKFPFSVRIP